MTDLFNEQAITWVIASIGLIFQAGILYGAFRGMRRDLNGVGRKVRGIQGANEQRYLVMVVMSLLSDVPEANRAAYIEKARLFLDSMKDRHT